MQKSNPVERAMRAFVTLLAIFGGSQLSPENMGLIGYYGDVTITKENHQAIFTAMNKRQRTKMTEDMEALIAMRQEEQVQRQSAAA